MKPSWLTLPADERIICASGCLVGRTLCPTFLSLVAWSEVRVNLRPVGILVRTIDNRGHRTDGQTRTTVDTFIRINHDHWVPFHGVPLRHGGHVMHTVNRARLDTGGVNFLNAFSSYDIWHFLTPLYLLEFLVLDRCPYLDCIPDSNARPRTNFLTIVVTQRSRSR